MVKSSQDVIEKLVDNSLALQHKTTELIKSINSLTSRIDTMVSLFEEAAKHIESGSDEPLRRKLDSLLEQNKNIARGLILLERYVRERISVEDNFPPKPLPRSDF